MRDAMGERVRLAGAGAGDDEERRVPQVENSLTLRGVERGMRGPPEHFEQYRDPGRKFR